RRARTTVRGGRGKSGRRHTLGGGQGLHAVAFRKTVTLRPFFRRAARLEYDEATTWYEAQRKGLGREFVEEIDRALSRACDTPKQFPIVLRDVRRVVVSSFPYSVFFREKPGRLV